MLSSSQSRTQDNPASWLSTSALLDLNDPKLRIQAISLTQLADTDTQKVVAIHRFIKAIPFGRAACFDHVSAGDVLRSRQGDCHTKGTLFVALMRCVGLPAQLRFVTMPSTFLRGIISLPNAKCQMPNAKCQMPNAKCQMPNAKCQYGSCHWRGLSG